MKMLNLSQLSIGVCYSHCNDCGWCELAEMCGLYDDYKNS